MTFKKYKIILGSASPRRKQLLECMGWNPEVRTKNVPEIVPPGLEEREIPIHLSKIKANALINELKARELLITADTIVWLNGELLEKPGSREEAFSMLNKLSGETHQVYTGVCFSTLNRQECFSIESKVTFEKLSPATINDYIEHYKPFDKAGSYGAQECLPEGLNPCSDSEIEFMKKNSLNGLFENTLAMDSKKHVSFIKSIEGSYFNVMGLPVEDVYKYAEEFLSKNN